MLLCRVQPNFAKFRVQSYVFRSGTESPFWTKRASFQTKCRPVGHFLCGMSELKPTKKLHPSPIYGRHPLAYGVSHRLGYVAPMGLLPRIIGWENVVDGAMVCAIMSWPFCSFLLMASVLRRFLAYVMLVWLSAGYSSSLSPEPPFSADALAMSCRGDMPNSSTKHFEK